MMYTSSQSIPQLIAPVLSSGKHDDEGHFTMVKVTEIDLS